jgi:hypothetical protein
MLLIGGLWIAAVIVLFVANTLVLDVDSGEGSDGWCRLLLDGEPSAADPDCVGWDGAP